MTSTEGDRPEEENPNNNNRSHVRIQSNMTQEGNSGSGVTSGRIVFGPPRPSFDRRTMENTETGQNNNDGRTTTATDNHNNHNHSSDGINRGIPGTSIPMRMRINMNSSSSNGNHNDPASAASAAFAALQHPHVQAAMARHASRSRTVENSTINNAAGRPQSTTHTTLRYNTPTPQQITVVPAFSSSPMPTAPLPPLQPQPLHVSNSIDTMDIKLAKNAVCSKLSNKNNLKAFLKRIECRICFGKFSIYSCHTKSTLIFAF